MQRPAVSLIVPFLGGLPEARAMLAALGRLRRAEGDEVIVVDNTAAGIVDRAVEDAAVRVLRGEREHSSYYARNLGAERSSTDWLLFVDSDCRPAESLFDAYLREPPGERVGVVSGGVVAAPEQRALVARYARDRGHIGEAHHLSVGPRPAAIGANMLLRREAWEELGGFHEGVRSGADVELCWRLQEAGWELLHRPEARVEHVHPERLGPMLRKTARHAAGRVWVNRRYPGVNPLPRPWRLARHFGGSLVWAMRGDLERARFKLLDAAWLCANVYGWVLGDNRAIRPGRSEGRTAGGTPRGSEKRLALLTDAFPARSETFVYNEALALRELGWAVGVESSSRPFRPEREVARQLPVRYLEDDPIREKLRDLTWLAARHPLRCLDDLLARRRWSREEDVWPLASLAPAARRLARERVRHLHVHFAAGAALHGLRLSGLLGASYSVTAHAYDIFERPANLREKLERAAFATSGCEYNVDYLRRLVGEEDRERIHEVVMGVDPERFRRQGPPLGGRTVAAVGRLVEKKGFAYLIDAAALLRERGAIDSVVICGEGPLRAELADRIDRRGVGDVVALTEAWGADEVRELLERADVFAMPCVVAASGDRDSMPVVVKEALAMEIPVVGSDEVGMPEMVEPGWGRLVPPADPEALADAIAELLALPAAERARMGAAGREFVVERCDLYRETARLARLIETSAGAA